MNLDFAGKAVLITEGAFGLGLHVALAFARRGAACAILHREPAPDESRILQPFADAGTPLPTLAQVDAARDENLDNVLRELQARHGEIEALIQVGTTSPEEPGTAATFEEYSRQDFLRAVENDAWSLVEYPRAIKRVFGAYPRYIVGVVGTSALEYSPGADFIAASESAMESLCRYVNHHLFDEDVCVNVLRYRNVALDNVALDSVATDNSAHRYTPPEYFVPPEEVAEAAVALCSGLMDCMSGHVLTVDRGTGFFDNLMRLYTEREQYQP